MVRATGTQEPIACMVVYSMHPTVLREDSAVVSADFPGAARRYVQQHGAGNDCPFLYHTGPAGNQSPRHAVKANTLAEMERLGAKLGEAIVRVIPSITHHPSLELRSAQAFVELPARQFPSVQEAEAQRETAAARLAELRKSQAVRQTVRKAEVDWFGAEETVTLTRAAADGRLDSFYRGCLPAEIQVFKIGPWSFVGWAGEIFVEYALALKAEHPDTFVISLANGELQGYIATEEAAAEGGYEATNALFAPRSGTIMAETAQVLLKSLQST
jgi:hypothetical protein